MVKKGPKWVKNGKKLKMPIEISIMSAFFCMFAQFIYVHLTIYRNLTPNITKGQKSVKKGSKIGKKKVKFKTAHRNTIYECNFWHVYTMTIYRNLTPNITKGQKRVKKGSKLVKKL